MVSVVTDVYSTNRTAGVRLGLWASRRTPAVRANRESVGRLPSRSSTLYRQLC